MRRLLLILALCAWASSAHAQTLASGSLTTNGQSLTAGLSAGGAPIVGHSVQITGTWTGTLTFQASVDGTTFVSLMGSNVATGSGVTSTTANGAFSFTNGGYRAVRVAATAAMTGTAVVTIQQGYAGGGGGGGSGGGAVTCEGAACATAAKQDEQTTNLDDIENLLEASAANDVAHDAADTGNPVKIGGRADSTSPADVSADGDRVNAWFNLAGAMGHFPVANVAGGCTIGTTTSIISAASVNETQVKATAGQVYSISAFSLDATPVYLKLYNDTGANIDETDTPVYRLMIPANATASLGSGFVFDFGVGLEFTTAITFRVTTGIADNDTGALTANEVLINVCYQ